MVIDVKAQTELIIQEIKRTYSKNMIFKLDDLASYNAAKQASNFTQLRSSVRIKIYEVAYSHGSDAYRKK